VGTTFLPRDDYEAVVIGSGFGGAVAACRLAQAGIDVAVVERGRRFPPGTFARDLGRLDSGWLWLGKHGLYDIRPFSDMLCVVAAGYGGGSLAYANVAIRPPPQVFEQAWPSPYRRPVLDPYYDLAAHMLAVRPVQPDPETGALPPKTLLMESAARRLGYSQSLFRPNLAVTFADPGQPEVTRNRFGIPQRTCINCGECDIGCNVGAKNTLDHNYLALAERHGTQVGTLTEATALERAGRGYRVHLHQRGDRETRRVITARHVFVCAGALGSTELLLRSRDQHQTLPGLPPALGSGYSGNGDFIAFGHRTRDMVSPGSGPTITTAMVREASIGGRPEWFLIEDGGYSAHLAGLVRALYPAQLVSLGIRTSAMKHLHAGRAAAGEITDETGHTAVLLVIGRDRANGRIELTGRRHRLRVRWDTAGHIPLYAAQEAACREIVRALGGHLAATPTWRYLRQPVSVHNLGGCRMADNPAAGVVDTDGQVFGHPGLYVLDGAILPAATGVNPSHTITAVAERCVETAIRRITGTPTWTAPQRSETRPADRPEDRVIAAARPLLSARHGLGFSETMRGRAMIQAGQEAGPSLQPASFTVAVTIPDLESFLADPQHTASVSGLVTVAGITSARGARVTTGVLHLLAPAGTAGQRTMVYRLPFTGIDGQQWALHGGKDVWHRRGLDIWHATTTLYATVVPLGPQPAPVPAALSGGEMRLRFPDFLREMRSLHAIGSGSRIESARIVQRFLRFWAGAVLRAFTSPGVPGPATQAAVSHHREIS
jgi:cholesterol oxidase